MYWRNHESVGSRVGRRSEGVSNVGVEVSNSFVEVSSYFVEIREVVSTSVEERFEVRVRDVVSNKRRHL